MPNDSSKIDITDQINDNVDVEEIDDIEDIKCKKCNSGDDGDNLLLCDVCNSGCK